MAKKSDAKQAKISKIEITNEKLSGRGGLLFFLRYVENIGFYSLIDKKMNNIKGSLKGLGVGQFIKQILAYFINGDDLSMSSFDRRKADEAYQMLLENRSEDMASSHQIKRFFRRLMPLPTLVYRRILLLLFIWRLRVEKPTTVVLFADTVVWNNDDAKKRQGVEPTYKKKKGFQPLQISWGPYVVDALFRSGSVHSNHGDDLIQAITRLTHAIRRFYKEVPILVLTDSGFLDQKNFTYFENQLKIFYICVGKLYDDIKEYVQAVPLQSFRKHLNGLQEWFYVEFGNQLKSWHRFRRCIYTTLQTDEDGQILFEFARPDTVIYTNIGMDPKMTDALIQAGGQSYLEAETIIELNHQRGKSELNHRSQKEFAGKEQFPFERFGMNQAYYYFLLFSHLLYEAYKHDVTQDILSVSCYPVTFRRKMLDFAVKIISRGGQFILKVPKTIFDHLNLKELWRRTGSPPHPIFAQ